MSALLSLILLNVFMAITTFGAGLASIKFNIVSNHMSKVSALSTGILIGTALGVILPEGVSTLFSASETLEDLESLGLPASFIVGASLLLGFIVLFVIEHTLNLREAPSASAIADSRYSRLLWTICSSILKSTLTLSLIVHSFVDGIALGVSFLDDNEVFKLLFFFMIIIHKIPTAFSLTVILLREGMSSNMCKYHTLAFALTTPLSSIFTYFLVLLFDIRSPFVLGILLLFSAGTFLFSVLHVMKENSEKTSPGPAIASVQSLPFDPPHATQTSYTDLLFTIVGMLLPLLFSLTGAD